MQTRTHLKLKKIYRERKREKSGQKQNTCTAAKGKSKQA